MKILFITTQFPYPLDNGGKIGAFNGISVVGRDNDVTVLSFSEEQQYVNEGIKFFNEKFSNVEFLEPIKHDIHIRKKRMKLLKVMLKDFILGVPYVTEKFENKQMYKLIDKMLSCQSWDIIFIDYLNMQVYADYIIKNYADKYNKLILKDHNIEYEIVKQEAQKSKGVRKLILEAEWKKTLNYEVKAIKNADIVYSVCDANTEFMKKYNTNSYTMLPTYETNIKEHKRTDNHNILFMGNLSWGANMDGLKWFVDRVMPKIVNKVPDVKLTIIGSGPAENPFLDIEYIDYKGYLKDISKAYDNQTVFVVPLFEGSGIRIKILEAFDNEIAVVSTRLACETIGASDNIEILIRDDEDSFSEAVIKLLTSDSIREKQVVAAKEFLINKFSLETRRDEFEDVVRCIKQ